MELVFSVDGIQFRWQLFRKKRLQQESDQFCRRFYIGICIHISACKTNSGSACNSDPHRMNLNRLSLTPSIRMERLPIRPDGNQIKAF
jgi:hypothetical protein